MSHGAQWISMVVLLCKISGSSGYPFFAPRLHVLVPRLLDLRNYKTVMCEFFQRGDGCRSGSQCTFAHGSHELRAANSFLKMMDGLRFAPL